MRKGLGYGALLFAAVAVSCAGGGSGGGESVVPSGPSGSTLFDGSFVPAQQAPLAGEITAAEGNASSNLVTVSVQATGIDNLFQAGFDVVFDSSAVEFVTWSAGGVLEQGGDTPIYAVAPQAGRLVVAISRSSGAAGGITVGTTQPMIHLTFRVLTEGFSPLTLENGAVHDAQAPLPQPIPNLGWHGGQFEAR